MENQDLLSLIMNNVKLRELHKFKSVNSIFYNCIENVINEKLKLWRSFIKFKIRTVFPKNYNRKRTYYTFKNRYINKEEIPILAF